MKGNETEYFSVDFTEKELKAINQLAGEEFSRLIYDEKERRGRSTDKEIMLMDSYIRLYMEILHKTYNALEN